MMKFCIENSNDLFGLKTYQSGIKTIIFSFEKLERSIGKSVFSVKIQTSPTSRWNAEKSLK